MKIIGAGAQKISAFPKPDSGTSVSPVRFDSHRRDACATAETASSSLESKPELRPAALLSPPGSRFRSNLSDAGRPRLKIVMLGPSLAAPEPHRRTAIYRGLIRELAARGHEVLFLERSATRPTAARGSTSSARIEFYSSARELKERFAAIVRDADFVVVGSGVSEGVVIGDWVTRQAQGATAFYDMDTPVTIANMVRGKSADLSTALISRYRIYLSGTGGPILHYLGKHYGLPMARPFYASVDATEFFPENRPLKRDLGYECARSENRHPAIDRLLLEPARRWAEGRFAVSGEHFPRGLRWPKNVKRLPAFSSALPQRAFYNSQRFTLQSSDIDLTGIGYTPDVRLFEAAACAAPIISDFWPGLDSFFEPDEEILISHSSDETLVYLEEIPEIDRRRIGHRARERVLAQHTVRHRAMELETVALEVLRSAMV